MRNGSVKRPSVAARSTSTDHQEEIVEESDSVVADQEVLIVEIGDVAALTEGEGSGGSEDKRYQYN
jgi:hypothetical protein